MLLEPDGGDSLESRSEPAVMLLLCLSPNKNAVYVDFDSWKALKGLLDSALKSGSRILQAHRKPFVQKKAQGSGCSSQMS